MKVNNDHLTGLAPSANTQSAEADRVERLKHFRSADTGHAGGHDQVNLSGLAAGIVQASEASAAAHASRVQALAKAYQSGRYEIQPAALSRKLIAASLANGVAPNE